MLIALMLLLYAAGNVFLICRGLRWIRRLGLSWHRIAAGVFAGLVILAAALPVLGALANPDRAAGALQRAGNLWLGFCLYLFLALLPLEIAGRLRRRGRPAARGRHSAFSFWGGIAVLVIAAAGVSYGIFHAGQMRTTSYTVVVPSESAAEERDSLRIVFTADLHMGSQIGCPEIKKMVDRINAADPDVVLLGGDLFDSGYDLLDDPAQLEEILRGIRSCEGVYAVYGNHDVSETLIGGFSVTPLNRAFRDPRMTEFLENAHIRMLEDQAVALDGGKVWLAGRLDGEKAGDGTNNRLSAAALMKKTKSGTPVIVLEHEPVELQQLSDLGASLILSGHTHDGQLFPLNLAQKLIWDNPYGRRQYGQAASIVTSGVGLYGPPMRVMTDSEVVVINLQFYLLNRGMAVGG